MDIGILAAAVSLIISLVMVGVTAGIQLGKIAELARRIEEDRKMADREHARIEKQACDDRTSSKEKFAELYDSRNRHDNELIETSANVTSICNRLDKIESAIDKMDDKLDRLLSRGA